MIDGTRERGPWCVRRAAAGRNATSSSAPDLRPDAEDLLSEQTAGRTRGLAARVGAAFARLHTRALVGLVLAAATFGAGSLAHAIPQRESSPVDTSRKGIESTGSEGRTGSTGDRVTVFANRPLSQAPQPDTPSTWAPAAPRILKTSFSIGNGPVRWYPPRRVIAVAVKFDQPVTVDTVAGTPLIDVVLGTHELRRARYAGGSGSVELVFHYATGDWNRNFDAATVVANTLNPNGGRIDGSEDRTAANLAHAAGRLDNVRARSESAAAPTLVALPPAAVRTPLPSLRPAAGPTLAGSGTPGTSDDRGTALATVAPRAQLRGVEPLLDLSLFQQTITGSRAVARVEGVLPAATGESSSSPESPLGDVRQFRVTPQQDDGAPATSNALRAASTAKPPAPFLWAWVEGQTRIRLQWSGGHRVSPAIESHRVEVCEEAAAGDCADDDWQLLEDDHPQTTPWHGNAYTHTGLTEGSTRHYRVASRNANGLGAFSRVRSGTTELRPMAAECATAVWSAYLTVATFGANNDQGFRRGELNGALTENAAGTDPDDGFSIGSTTYTVNQLYYGHGRSTPTGGARWYFPASYHFALSHYPEPEDKMQDLTLYVGETALPMASATHSLQSYGEVFRWGLPSDRWSQALEDSDPYTDTFDYEDGDKVMVCLTDSAPNVSLVLTPASIAENGGVSTVTATINQGVSETFEVSVTAEPESPAVAADFTLSENTVLSFAANATTSSGTVTITAADNDVDAANKTIIVRGGLMSGVRPRAPQPVELTIEDDDAAPVLALAVDPAAIVEDGGTSNIVVSTGDTTFAADQTITLTFAGSAEKGTDYTVSAAQFTFPASEHSVTVTVTAENDSLDEDEETILVGATHDGSAVGTQQQVTITDDDDEPELSITSPTVDEGDPALFAVTLNPQSGREVTVSYVTEDDTATAGSDYTALASDTLTFAAGDTAHTLTVATIENTLNEPTETFSVTLSAATNATLGGGDTSLSGTGTITDDDRVPKVSIADAAAVTEGTAAQFEVSLDVISGNEVTVTYATADGTAKQTEDYTAVASATLTFDAGDTAKTITVATTDDDLNEDDGETFTVTLSGPKNADLATKKSATGQINDNDGEPELSIANAEAVTEGTGAEFVVTLDPASGREVTVNYATGHADDTAGTSDYTAVASATLTFDAGDTAQTITVATTNDDLHEDDGETFTVTLSDPRNADLAANKKSATGAIDDNDGEPELSIANAEAVTEGTGAEFVVTLDPASGREVTVDYATADGTAKQTEDYTAVASATLTFDAGDTAQTITVATTNDTLDEDDGETFTVTLSGPSNADLAANKKSATGAIDDNDGEPELSIADAEAVTEGTGAEFVVTLDPASGREVTVDYATADGTAKQTEDYTAVASATLTFDAGDTAQTITVATTNDTLDEDDGETFTVTLSGPSNADLAANKESATGAIDDNDGEPELSIADAEAVTEGTGAEFVVTLDPASGREVTVDYATGHVDDTADSSVDYTAVASTTLTFDAGDIGEDDHGGYESGPSQRSKRDVHNDAEQRFERVARR